MTLSPAYSKAQQEITSDDSLAQPPLESSTIHKAETGEPGDMVIQESLPREDQTMVHKNKPPRAKYDPTIFKNHFANFQFRHGVDFECTLWDTVGNDDFQNAFLPPTRQAHQWFPEIEPHIRGGDFVLLLGLKQDLRYNSGTILKLKEQGRTPITIAEGEAMAEKIGALAYFEYSAKRYLGIENIFEAVLGILLEAER
ncbi:unnamed protein product [Alternaria alternata]